MYVKSSMVVSGGLQGDFKRRLAARLGMRLVNSHDRGIELPRVAGRSRSALFHNICDRLWSQINGWKSKLLSQARKVVLIKSVFQSLPTYAMSCFCFPDHLINELEREMRDF
ncbi:UNVERIFIED_CONTAM: hypothetical protein Slati_0432100 [Sesamum latifolium]|uniref:Uncharacterized protein n=1 Tax=Sesamum latifolium TaxID=2727402 RepID=A0AAW2XVN0_9LAMI